MLFFVLKCPCLLDLQLFLKYLQKMKRYLILFFLIFCSLFIQANNEHIIDSLKYIVNSLNKKVDQKTQIEDSLWKLISNNTLTLEIKDWDKKKAIFNNNENWFIKSSPAIIGIFALIVSIVISLITIRGSKRLEKEKFLRESEERKLNELKVLVSQFIRWAVELNQDLENEDLKQRILLTNKLSDVYYLIKFCLNGSDEHIEIENLIDYYMETIGNYNPRTTIPDDYLETISILYNKIKILIHPRFKDFVLIDGRYEKKKQ